MAFSFSLLIAWDSRQQLGSFDWWFLWHLDPTLAYLRCWDSLVRKAGYDTRLIQRTIPWCPLWPKQERTGLTHSPACSYPSCLLHHKYSNISFPSTKGMCEGGRCVPYPASSLSSTLAKAEVWVWLQQCSLLSLQVSVWRESLMAKWLVALKNTHFWVYVDTQDISWPSVTLDWHILLQC